MNDATNLIVEVSLPLTEARTLKIATQEQYIGAGERLKSIKLLMQKVAAAFDPIIQKAHAAHKEAVAKKKEHEAPLLEAEDVLKKGMIRYQQEQEAARLRDQARLEEQARKAREKLEALAAKAAEKGREEKAAELLARAATVPTPVVAATTPQVSGISMRATYRAEVSNKAHLIEACAGGRRVFGNPNYAGPERRVHARVPQAALMADTGFLNQSARSLKTELKYPGVKVFEQQVLASRSA